jgi:hypothetical protein
VLGFAGWIAKATRMGEMTIFELLKRLKKMLKTNDFKFTLGQRVMDDGAHIGVVYRRKREYEGNEYQVQFDRSIYCYYLKEHELRPVDIDHPCPGGVDSITLVLNTGKVLRGANHKPPLDSLYHTYKWNSDKGRYILDTDRSCIRKGEIEGLR